MWTPGRPITPLQALRLADPTDLHNSYLEGAAEGVKRGPFMQTVTSTTLLESDAPLGVEAHSLDSVHDEKLADGDCLHCFQEQLFKIVGGQDMAPTPWSDTAEFPTHQSPCGQG